ncbi:MAG: hypothetical protein E7098_00495 [Mediterranea massiliensis]|nr:hypothetical protein [Mediterranea massiliensis]
MNTHNDNPIEILNKLLVLQNERVRKWNDIMSKTKTVATANWLMQHKTACESIANQLLRGFINLPESDRNRLLSECINEIDKCNKALYHLGMDAIKDEVISKLADSITNKSNKL